MSFRTSENLQRYEYVRFHLDNVIEQPANNQSQKKKKNLDIGSQSTIDRRCLIFSMGISK